jgi:hypothetical protein
VKFALWLAYMAGGFGVMAVEALAQGNSRGAVVLFAAGYALVWWAHTVAIRQAREGK